MHIELTDTELLLWAKVKARIEQHHGIPMSDTAAMAWIIYACIKAI